MKVKRQIIVIDEEKCDGCGLCIPACHEGALAIVETPNGPKARLVKENFCDGLGACIGECPRGAIKLEEREAEPFDEKSVLQQHNTFSETPLHEHSHAEVAAEGIQHQAMACPSARVMTMEEKKPAQIRYTTIQSALRQWPIQLHLVPPTAPYFQNADVMLVADCVPFAYPNFHSDFLKDYTIAIACPKLDYTDPYVDKIVKMIELGNIKSLAVAIMEVPCCMGLFQMARMAVEASHRKIPLRFVRVSIKGEVLEDLQV